MTKLRRARDRTFSSLRIRNYRLYFTGQLVSVSGTWVQWVAQSWLVVKTLEGNGVQLGVLIAMQCTPILFAGLWGGLVADRFDKRTILRWTNAVQASISVLLGILVTAGVVQLWQLYLIAFASGCVMVVDMPTRQSFVMEMVGPKEVPNAVALNSVVLNGGRLIGPPIAAGIITLFGDRTGPAFFVNALTFLTAFFMLWRMDPAALHSVPPTARAQGQVREGLRFMFRTRVLRDTLILIAALTTLGFNFIVVLPLIATVTFHGGAGIYALLSSIMAVGSILGALATAARRRPTMPLMVGSAFVFGLMGVAAAFGPTIAAESIILVGVGFASMTFMATANSTLQLNSPPSMRGRVMAAYALLIVGGNTIGGPIIGAIAEAFTPRTAFFVGGSCSMLAAAVIWAFQRRDHVTSRAPLSVAATPADRDLVVETAAPPGP